MQNHFLQGRPASQRLTTFLECHALCTTGSTRVSGSEFPHRDSEKVKPKDSSDARIMGHHLRIATDMQWREAVCVLQGAELRGVVTKVAIVWMIPA